MTSTLSTRDSASRGLPAQRGARPAQECRSWSTPPSPRLSDHMLAAAAAVIPAPRRSQRPSDEPPQQLADDVEPASAAVEPTAPGQALGAESERRRARALDHVLTVLALLGLVMMGITITASYTGLRPLVVRSGSMEPVIHTGGLVLVRTIPARDIRVGDVVAVERPDGVRVTHRVLTTTPAAGGRASLELKGDANEDKDPFPVVVAEAGRLVYSAPWLGRASAELTSARGGFVLGAVITGVLFSVVGGRRRS